MRFLPPSTQPAFKGRVASKWLIDNMHRMSHEDFYDERLLEEDLKKKYA
jgi:hypothetical protein